MRMIGHNILLNLGDSSSRIMPIEISENTYRIHFENPLSFEPNTIMPGIDSLMDVHGIASRYLVEIESCESLEIVHSYFRDSSVQGSLTPCLGRPLPQDCYKVVITMHEPDEKLNTGNISSSQTGRRSNHVTYLFIPLLILAGATSLYMRKKQSATEAGRIEQIGNYQFDPEHRILSIDGVTFTLSQKETELLTLLNHSVNETVTREVILQKVWQDEGDYIGRTLDVFISKLRKKLEADPLIKIINIRGIGYKLITKETA